MPRSKSITARLRAFRLGCAAPLGLLIAGWASGAQAVATSAPITGEIERITINNPADHWSGGTIVVGGQNIIIPRNLLMDLPANRLTLQELFEQAPATCVATGETGLAKGDSCNTSGTGGFATISANRTNAGNTIAGDVLIQKGTEAVTGVVTYIDYTDGYFRLNGNPNDPLTGVMVRLNDPDGRHTIQQGRGCPQGSAPLLNNCSPDPRFTLDPDNYTNVFGSGYPLCIPSTVQRTFADTLGLGTTTAQAAADGSADVLCPTINRPAAGPVGDSRRFAPIRIGDSITAEGNFETIGGVRFLSAHSTMVSGGLSTSNAPGQPDYLFLDEVEIDAPGFQNQRARTLIIGFTTRSPADVLIWSIHYDPSTNSPHEFPLATSLGCDAAAGPATCTGQGLAANGTDIFKIRHDVDFLAGARPRLDPCAHLKMDARIGGLSVCPNSPTPNPAANNVDNTDIAGMFGILSPIPHELMARTGTKFASRQSGIPLITLDINGNEATNGEYLFPLGMNLGGVSVPEFVEIDLNALNTPTSFSGIPWNLDRRLSPGGCFGPCEGTPQPLDPFPFEGIDPRTQAAVPTLIFNDPTFTASPLTPTALQPFGASNRILSFVREVSTGIFNFDGNNTILAWPPQDPALIPIGETVPVILTCAGGVLNTAPLAVNDVAVAPAGADTVIDVLANDTDAQGNIDPATVVITSGPSGDATAVANADGTVTFDPGTAVDGAVITFEYTVSDKSTPPLTSSAATVTVTVAAAVPPPPPANNAPVAVNDTATTTAPASVTIAVLANDTDADGNPLTVTAVTQGIGGTVVISANNTVGYTPNAGFSGVDAFTYTVSDGNGGTATGTVTVTVNPAPVVVEVITVTQAQFRTRTSEWRVSGTGSIDGSVVTIRLGGNGQAIGSAVVNLGVWTFRQRGSLVLPANPDTVNAVSSGGGTATLVVISRP